MPERTDSTLNDTVELPGTPSQTVGPFLTIGLDWGRAGRMVVPDGTPGAFWIRGEILDGAGDPIPDALVETWQAAPDGRFDHPDDPRGRHPGWRGLGRSDTRLGEYAVHTVLPGPVPTREGRPQAPHIDVSVFARGMLHRVVTRIYFPDHAATNASRNATFSGMRSGSPGTMRPSRAICAVSLIGALSMMGSPGIR